MKTLTLGIYVKRLASDYTAGREGRVIEISESKGRARVHWERERSGTPMSLRTWIRFQDLAPLTTPAEI